MKNVLLALFVCIFLFSCGKSEKAVKTVSVDTIKQEISKFTGTEIEPLPVMENYSDSLDNKQFEGFCAEVKDIDSTAQIGARHTFVKEKRAEYKKSGYLLFVFENDEGKVYIGAIKSDDELDIVRWRKTDGINHGLTNKDIVDKLKTWEEKSPFEVLEIGRDLVWIQFEKPVIEFDVKAFADEGL
ncbi:MAG: DUF4253 domain-containing protein [Dysgonomonas sp.]